LDALPFKNSKLPFAKRKAMFVFDETNLVLNLNFMILSTSIRLAIAIACLSFAACNKPSPEKAFDVAVLNSNMLVGFANDGMERELDQPSAKMGKTKDEILQMKRSEVVEDKLKFVEENYDKLKGFSPDDDNKEIIQNSLALHEFILPVYKNEYMQLAKLYDENASKDEIEKQKTSVRDKYASKFETLFNTLISSGKAFAKKHDITVNWAM
jgi:hypothetical protein